jgi:APA family basic amino acid/polyamine antiporter
VQVSCAAVARSWGEKLAYATGQHWVAGSDTFGQLSVAAGAAPAVCALLLMHGLRLGKNTISCFTVVKILLVLFMVAVGCWHSSAHNLVDPYVPPAGVNSAGQPAYGWEGVLRGTAMAFFGFVGFDEVRRRVVMVA